MFRDYGLWKAVPKPIIESHPVIWVEADLFNQASFDA